VRADDAERGIGGVAAAESRHKAQVCAAGASLQRAGDRFKCWYIAEVMMAAVRELAERA
jgi:hypothetical protein